MNKTRDNAIDRIAREVLDLETLESRNADRLDFHDLSVCAIKDALERAYEAGRKAAPPTRITCPACKRDIEIRPI
ncbi:MAG: hypothetical protein KF757_05560 [Phycisphaeraceae bacterium]|nr:hypothetical protein [Phycisphaeraceae bacterium]MCW5763639.1 hypothetical protein [Phycisphaeraceae bacterium]